MYQLKLTLPGLPNITSNGPHGSWRAKAASVKIWKTAVIVAIGNRGPAKALTRARIVYTRHSYRQPDDDNLTISFKAIQDALKTEKVKGVVIREGVIVDDRPVNIGKPEHFWIYAPRSKGFVTIEVYEIEDEQTGEIA